MKKGWQVLQLDNVSKSIFAGGDVDKNNLSNTKTIDLSIPIYTNGEKNNGLYGFTNRARVLEPALTISARGTIGFSCIRNEPYFPAVRLISIIPNEKITLGYLSYFIKSQTLSSSGVSIPQLTVPMVKKFTICLPVAVPEQQAIVEKLDFAFDAIEKAKANIEKNIENAKELFQSKLNDIFSQKGEGWEEKTLNDIIIKTKNINPKEFPEKEFKYIDVSAVNRNTYLISEFQNINSINAPSRARKLVFENDIIYATVRPTLTRVCIIKKEFDNQICSTGYVVLRHNDKLILPEIIFYFLLTSKFFDAMEKLQKGASYPAVTDNEIKSQIINFPISLKEQEKIVSQLDLLSEQTNLLQEKYKHKLANLEELKKSILEKAFKGELV